MAYLRLSNPTTNSCDYKVKLSNAFNTDYYKKLRITSTNYGSSTSNVSRYVESVTARNSSSVYVKGEINDGMSAGRTYTLYAYAQAANGTWYLAGSDDITMEDGGEADLRIDRITEYTDVDEFKVGEEVKFKVRIENRGNAKSSDHILKVYDEDGKLLDDNHENELDAGDYHNAYLYVTINKPGRQRLKFYISGGESEDRTEYRTYTWERKNLLITHVENMNFSKLCNLKLPGTFIDVGSYTKDYNYGKVKLTLKAGLINVDHTPYVGGLYSFNFNNNKFDGIRLGGNYKSLKYNVGNLPLLGDRISEWLKDNGYGEVTFGGGSIDIDKTGIYVVGFEVQDKKKFPPYADAGFTRLTVGFRLDWDDLQGLAIGVLLLAALAVIYYICTSPVSVPATAMTALTALISHMNASFA